VTRLDAALAERGLARSRTQAAKLIADGLVTVDGAPVVKASAQVAEDQVIKVAGSDHYVSRAAHKLIAALDGFELNPTGLVALDAGASTGGFSQVLLERGAAHVLAIDVGHSQLARELQDEPRLTSIEGFNIRGITREFIDAQGLGLPQLVVADLSFISLGIVLPAVVEAVGLDADYVLLVKPQFEVGRTGIREGIVHDAGLREDAVNGVLWAAWDLGLGTAGVLSSPIAGNAGNREYLVWLNASVGTNPTEWTQQVSTIVRG
jgi:23S rRNA (cytidine1920-2'-O)/16S rRNA (cytidine1409-2'-O)-methyltransferase